MSSPSTYNLRSIFNAMGIRSRRVMPDVSGGVDQVAVVADFSSSFAPEAIEARAIAGGYLPAVAGTRGSYELHSRGPGGVVVENVLTYGAAAANWYRNVWYIGINTTPQVSTAFPLTVIDVGGQPARSVMYREQRAGAVGTVTEAWKANTDQLPMRLYVPPGSYLFITYCATNLDTQLVLFWRELPEQRGPA